MNMASSALRIGIDATEQPVLRLIVPAVERSSYRASGRARPVAATASVAVVAAMTAAIALLNVSVPVRSEKALEVVSMALMPPEPPPPPATPPAPPQPIRAAVVAPVPIVKLPAPTPEVAVADTPAPPMPPTPAVASSAPGPAIVAPPAPPMPPGPVEAGDLSAKMISATPPVYPVESRRRREQGIVRLAVLVGLDGTVDEVSLSGSSGSFRLNRAALAAVRRWRWSPVTRNGSPVMVRGFVTIPFVLKG
jgi:protein TonB